LLVIVEELESKNDKLEKNIENLKKQVVDHEKDKAELKDI